MKVIRILAIGLYNSLYNLFITFIDNGLALDLLWLRGAGMMNYKIIYRIFIFYFIPPLKSHSCLLKFGVKFLMNI